MKKACTYGGFAYVQHTFGGFEMHFWGVRSAAPSRSALLLEGFLWRCTFGVYFASKDTPLWSVAHCIFGWSLKRRPHLMPSKAS